MPQCNYVVACTTRLDASHVEISLKCCAQTCRYWWSSVTSKKMDDVTQQSKVSHPPHACLRSQSCPSGRSPMLQCRFDTRHWHITPHTYVGACSCTDQHIAVVEYTHKHCYDKLQNNEDAYSCCCDESVCHGVQLGRLFSLCLACLTLLWQFFWQGAFTSLAPTTLIIPLNTLTRFKVTHTVLCCAEQC